MTGWNLPPGCTDKDIDDAFGGDGLSCDECGALNDEDAEECGECGSRLGEPDEPDCDNPWAGPERDEWKHEAVEAMRLKR